MVPLASVAGCQLGLDGYILARVIANERTLLTLLKAKLADSLSFG